jgi:hypothetical protein
MRRLLSRFGPALAVRDALTGCDELTFFQPVGTTTTDADESDMLGAPGTAVRAERSRGHAAKLGQLWSNCAASVRAVIDHELAHAHFMPGWAPVRVMVRRHRNAPPGFPPARW